MRPPRPAALVGAAAALVALLWLASLARVRTAGVAGDPWAVYYPVAQGLWRGDGVAAFAALTRSGIRMPGFAVALALAAAVRPNLVEAGQLVGVLAAAVTTWLVFAGARRLGASSLTAAAAALVVALHTETARASLEALPDSLFVALFSGAVLLALRLASGDADARTPRAALLLGLLAAAAFLTRPNGLALLVALPAGLALVLEPAHRRAVLRRYGAGVAIGLVPWVALMVGLRLHGLSYPQLSLHASHAIEAAARTSGWAGGILVATGRGVLDQPARVAATVPWWVALVGLATVAGAAWRAPAGSRPAARLVLVVGLLMGALLVPMHFEPRFYLFLGPLLVPAAALAAEAAGRRARLARAAPAVALTLLVPALVLEVPRTRADNAREAGYGEEIRSVARALSSLGQGDHLALVGVAGASRYLASRTMPTPMRDGRRSVLVVHATPADRGLDLWMALPDDERPAGLGAPLAEPERHAIFRAPEPVRRAAADTAAQVVPLAFTLALPQKRSCIEREVELTVAGPRRVVAVVEVPDDVSARLGLTQGERAVASWTTRSGRLELGSVDLAPGTATLILCTGDPLLGGTIAWRDLELASATPAETAGVGR